MHENEKKEGELMNEFDLIYKLDMSNEDVKKIVKDYGSVSEFCRVYIRYLQGDRAAKIKAPKSVLNNLTNFFDLSNTFGVGENSGYAGLVADILKIRPGFITYGPVEEIINSSMEEALSEQDKDIVRALYNLDGKNRDVSDLEATYRISQKDILARKQRAIKRLAAGRKKGQLQQLSKLIVDSAIVSDVMQEFLVGDDAIAETDYSGISKRKMELVEAILSKELEYITFTGDFDYIIQCFDVKTKISTSILSDDKKQILLDRANLKVKEIAATNKEKIVSLFNDRISGFVHDDNEERRYKSLEKEIKNSGLDEETISMLCDSLPELQQVQDGNSLKTLKNNLITRIRFPQTDLSIEQMPISDKAIDVLRKSDLKKVGDIIQYSRNELMKFACLRGLYIDEVLTELEKMGYDIPEDDSVPIEIYNHDKIHEDSFSRIAEEIRVLDIDEETKSYLISVVLEESIRKLEREYDKVERLIRTYKDIFRTHEVAKIETADEVRYRRNPRRVVLMLTFRTDFEL